MSLNFVLVLYRIAIGLWSELIASSVVQVMLLCIVLVAVEMSGDVGCWFLFVGCLVCESVFRVRWSELFILSAMSVPLWSVISEYHIWWWALKSPVTIVLSESSMYVMQFVMSVSALL